jgi:hypothetical protein
MEPIHWTIAGVGYALCEAGGVLSAAHVLMKGRTPQGAIAWMFFLVSFPLIALPLYWVFGPRKYANYVDARMRAGSPFDPVVDELRQVGEPFIVDRVLGLPGEGRPRLLQEWARGRRDEKNEPRGSGGEYAGGPL